MEVFQLPAMHVLMVAGDEASGLARALPILPVGEERHPRARDVGLLHDVAERVVAAMSIDEDKAVNPL